MAAGSTRECSGAADGGCHLMALPAEQMQQILPQVVVVINEQ
jgi:hypothetical protein